jgi:hypothetical protein
VGLPSFHLGIGLFNDVRRRIEIRVPNLILSASLIKYPLNSADINHENTRLRQGYGEASKKNESKKQIVRHPVDPVEINSV